MEKDSLTSAYQMLGVSPVAEQCSSQDTNVASRLAYYPDAIAKYTKPATEWITDLLDRNWFLFLLQKPMLEYDNCVNFSIFGNIKLFHDPQLHYLLSIHTFYIIYFLHALLMALGHWHVWTVLITQSISDHFLLDVLVFCSPFVLFFVGWIHLCRSQPTFVLTPWFLSALLVPERSEVLHLHRLQSQCLERDCIVKCWLASPGCAAAWKRVAVEHNVSQRNSDTIRPSMKLWQLMWQWRQMVVSKQEHHILY